MGEYQERPKQSSSNNSIGFIQAIELERYGGGYPKYSEPSARITPERLKELEEFDDKLFKRFCSPEFYNELKKQEAEIEQFYLSLENDELLNATEVSQNEQDSAMPEYDDRDRGFEDHENSNYIPRILRDEVYGKPKDYWSTKHGQSKKKGLGYSDEYIQASSESFQRRREALRQKLAESEKNDSSLVNEHDIYKDPRDWWSRKQNRKIKDDFQQPRQKSPESEREVLKQSSTQTNVRKDVAPISDKKDVANLTQAEKLGEVLILTVQKLPNALGSQLKAMISPTSIAIMVGVMGAYAASHAVGIGFIADASMLIGGGVFLGWQAVDVAKDVWAFAQYVNATTEEELDKAADHLAKAITTVGLDVILGILTKKAAGKVSQHIDELKQVDTAYAHSGGPTNSNAGNLNNTNNTSGQIQPRTTSNIVVPSNLNGLNPAEFKRLSDVVTAKGLKLSSLKALYDDLGLKNVQDIVKQTDDEIAAAIRAIELERVDSGHSIKRHGPQIKDNQLENRLKTGVAPDNRISFAPASTRFNNYESWVKTRDIAWNKIEKLEGIDLSKPPTSSMDVKYDIRIKYDKPIDDGFVPDRSTSSKIKVQDPTTGKKKKGTVFSTVNQVDGVTATFTRVIWDQNNSKWVVVQHYPLTQSWDNATKTYTQPGLIDVNVNLP